MFPRAGGRTTTSRRPTGRSGPSSTGGPRSSSSCPGAWPPSPSASVSTSQAFVPSTSPTSGARSWTVARQGPAHGVAGHRLPHLRELPRCTARRLGAEHRHRHQGRGPDRPARWCWSWSSPPEWRSAPAAGLVAGLGRRDDGRALDLRRLVRDDLRDRRDAQPRSRPAAQPGSGCWRWSRSTCSQRDVPPRAAAGRDRANTAHR